MLHILMDTFNVVEHLQNKLGSDFVPLATVSSFSRLTRSPRFFQVSCEM